MWTVSVIFYTLLTDSDVERYPYAKQTIFVFDCALTATYCTLPFYFIFFVAAFAMIIVGLIYRCEHALDAIPYSTTHGRCSVYSVSIHSSPHHRTLSDPT